MRQQQFLNAYIFGAVCPEKDKAAAFIAPFCNSDVMQIHLDIIAKEVEGHAVIILDRAGWHSSKALRIPSNITLIPLPPYSPELNPKENFWQIIKYNDLSNRVFKSAENIMDACQEAWVKFTEIKGNIKKLCSRKWAEYNPVS